MMTETEKKLASGTPQSSRGGGMVTLISAILIALVWVSEWPMAIILGLTWGLSAGALWISIWLKRRNQLHRTVLAAAMTIAAWALSAGCLWLIYSLMQSHVHEIFPEISGDRLFWEYAALALINIILMGLSVWFWLLGATLPRVFGDKETTSPYIWIQGAASRIKSAAVWNLVPLTVGFTIAAVILVQYEGTFGIRLISGLVVGSLSMRFLSDQALPVKEESAITDVQRSRRAALWMAGVLYFLALVFYTGFSAGFFPNLKFVFGMLLGILAAFAAWLLAFVKPLYWLFLILVGAAVALMFQLVLWVIFLRYM